MNMFKWFLTKILFIIYTVLKEGGSVEVESVLVPQWLQLGRGTSLRCLFHLHSDRLYSLKWYKDQEEFLRIIPGQPPIAFNIPGLYVDTRRSNLTHVQLRKTDVNSTGEYRCEVTGEAPKFQTDSRVARLSVLALPRRGPIIVGGKDNYRPGDKVRLYCIAGPSFPGANLTWFINGQPVRRSFLKGPEVTRSARGLETVSVGLEFEVEAGQLEGGELRIKCLATLASLYWNSSDADNFTALFYPSSSHLHQNSKNIAVIIGAEILVILLVLSAIVTNS